MEHASESGTAQDCWTFQSTVFFWHGLEIRPNQIRWNITQVLPGMEDPHGCYNVIRYGQSNQHDLKTVITYSQHNVWPGHPMSSLLRRTV